MSRIPPSCSIFDTFNFFAIFGFAFGAFVGDAASVRITDASSVGYEARIFDTFATFALSARNIAAKWLPPGRIRINRKPDFTIGLLPICHDIPASISRRIGPPHEILSFLPRQQFRMD